MPYGPGGGGGSVSPRTRVLQGWHLMWREFLAVTPKRLHRARRLQHAAVRRASR
jgi:hypothetical protein